MRSWRKTMFGDKPKDVPQPFALILVPEFTMMPVTSAIEPLRLANRMSEKALYRWTMHSVVAAGAASNILTMVNGDLEITAHATIIVCAITVQHHSGSA
jgi:transcriptional regulator GlxA family with amidase domain